MFKNLNLDSPMLRFLTTLTHYLVLSLVYIVSCIPIITIGASTAAFYSFTLDAVTDNEGRVLSSYFSAFRENFKKSTLIWLIQLLVMVFMAVNLFAAWNFYLAKGALGLGVLSMALCGMLIVMGTGVFVYPIVVCYDFPVKKIIADSFVMAIRNPHVTVSVLVLFALTGVGVYFVSGLFFFWFGLGIFFSSYFIWGLFMKYAGVTVPKKKKKKNSIDPYL